MRIAFLGIGAMGDGMARNLLQAGHELVAYNRTRSRAEALVESGAQVADTPPDALKGAEVVISILADDRALEEIVFASDAFLGALEPDAVHANMATISVAMGKRLAEAHAAARRGYVGAPVFGRPPAAAAGQLFIVASGAQGDLEACAPAFAAMGRATRVVGNDPVAAHTVKIGGNFMLASLIETLGEAFALTRSHGIDPEQFLDVLTSSLFPGPVYQTYGGMVARDQYEPAGFKLYLGLKDVGLALGAAEAKTVPMPIASLLRDRYLTALARGYRDLDWAALGRVCAEDAGLPTKS